MKNRLFSAALAAFCATGCGSDPSFVEQVYSDGVGHILVEVDYMEGMEPYAGEMQDKPLWDFYRGNLSALLHDAKTVTVPTSTAEMQRIPAGGGDYSIEDILGIARRHRDEPVRDEATLSLYVVFLDGYLKEEDGPNRGVIGVSIGDTSVIAIFKPVVQKGAYAPVVKRFVEQSVLIHESGHAFGLVDNGIPPVRDHLDREHGHHCTNDRCVMYYLNEGVADLVDFIQGGFDVETVLFGGECLQDTAAALGLSA